MLPRWLAWPERPQCAIFSNGMTALTVAYDYMHCKYLGLDPLFMGSILQLLTVHMLPGTPLENLQVCWKHLLDSYKTLGIQERYRGMRKLTLFQRKKQPPKLKGRASQIAALAEPLLQLWQMYMNEELAVHQKIRTLLKLNVALEKMMKQFQGALAFPEAEGNLFIKYSFALCQLHLELGHHFKDEELPLFPSLPKMHMLLHACKLCKIINPRLTWCFRGEDLQKISRNLAASSARGLQGPKVCVKMAAKLRVAWHLRLNRLVQE